MMPSCQEFDETRIGTAVEQLNELQEDHVITGEGLVERYPLREEQKSLGEE